MFAKYRIERTSILYVTLHFRDRRGSATLRYSHRAEIPVFNMCEQKPYPVQYEHTLIRLESEESPKAKAMFVLYRIERTSIRHVTLRFRALIGYVRTVLDSFCAGTKI